MANPIPLKAIFNPDGSVKTLAEFTTADAVSVSAGGTGVTALGTAIGGHGVSITNGSGAVVRSLTITVDETVLNVPGLRLTGTIDGGSYS